MTDHSIVLNKVENTLLATMQSTLSHSVLEDFQQELLNRLERIKVDYVLCDLSGLELLDIDEYVSLCNTLSMASLMGVRAIMVGLTPGVAATIVDYDVDISAFQYARNIDDGLALAKQ